MGKERERMSRGKGGRRREEKQRVRRKGKQRVRKETKRKEREGGDR